MNELKNKSFATRLKFALAGLGHAVGAERSVRTQLMVLVAVLGALGYLRPAPVWWALVLLVSSAVIAAELFNTAIERLADQLQPELHPQIRVVKDCAAAAVLVLSAGALCVAAALAVNLWNAR
ncbi:MAG TPA: diacylglycerol kinase [Steroidobacteraceae bacterium]|nr:diacylglycerol kinase [Steroidobacteraceae bacterium]